MYDNILPCPASVVDVACLPDDEVRNIQTQNQIYARDMYNNWVAEASEEAQAHPNEDAHAYLFKMRRDDLLEILGNRLTYTWRKRDIAQRILHIMGYDFNAVEDLNEDRTHA